jgi:transglutaminase-like putative cysteine protease
MAALSAISTPQYTISPFSGPADTIRTMVDMVRGQRGERSMVLYGVTAEVVRGIQPKDYLSEILAVRNFVAEKVKYLNDPLTTELVRDPQNLIEQVMKSGKAVGDCDDIATLMAAMARQLGRDAEFITVGFGAPGKYSHVFTRVKEPKSGVWIVCDPVAGTEESRMLSRVSTWKSWVID